MEACLLKQENNKLSSLIIQKAVQIALLLILGFDILIASDAIGMGLNLNIKRIVFSSLEKFDGKEWRYKIAIPFT